MDPASPAGRPGLWLSTKIKSLSWRRGNNFPFPGLKPHDLFLPPPRYHTIHTMATMAAAIAASLPTVQAAPTPAAPAQQTLPASWNKSVDAEAEIPITTVQIDGLVRLDQLC